MLQTLKLCDPLITHGPYLSTLEVQHNKMLYKFTLLYFLLVYVTLTSIQEAIKVNTAITATTLIKANMLNQRLNTYNNNNNPTMF